MTADGKPDTGERDRLWTGSGIIVIDKPRGPSSHEVAAWVGRMLGCPVGHAGTLDPQVSGLLLVMLGNAVRLAPLLLQHEKEYVCLMRLHGDADPARIREVAAEFSGRLYQRPPRRSAVKRSLRIREIRELEILSTDERLVLFRARCDAGTYIRSLCHHMGLALGVGAHMVELRRTRSGAFGEGDLHTLHEVQDAALAAREGEGDALARIVLPVDRAVPGIPVIVLRDTAIDAVCHGAVLAGVGILSAAPFRKGEIVALLSQKNEFVALGRTLVVSEEWEPGKTGLAIAPTTVFMAPGTYPRGWTKSDKPPVKKTRAETPKTVQAAGGQKRTPAAGKPWGTGKKRPGNRQGYQPNKKR